SIRADTAAPLQKIVEVMDAAKSAGLKIVSLTPPRAGQIDDKLQINIDTKATGATSDKVATNQPFLIEAKFIAIPHRAGAEKRNLLSEPLLLASQVGKASQFLDAQGLKAVLAWYASQGIEPLASPRVTTLSGQEVELSLSKAEVQHGESVHVGVALGVAPNVQGDSVVLQLRLRMGN